MAKPNRDVIVVGASMRGINAVHKLLAGLPATATTDADLLAGAIGTASILPVRVAAEGQAFTAGCVYVPPADHHLLVGHDHVHVRRGPRENGSRPGIDPLFRSAATTCTTRVIGVVLTGLLNDGTAGLRAIKHCGGVAVVQDPSDAAFDPMPRSAIRHVEVDHVVPLDELPRLLVHLTGQAPPPELPVSEDLRMEALIAAQEIRGMEHWNRAGAVSPLTCPDCHGALREIQDGDLVRYRCHTGMRSPWKRLEPFRSRPGNGL